MNAEGALLPSGGYRHLRSTRVAEAIYDATAAFCDRFIPKGSRTHDQMVQAARSGIGWRQGVRGKPRLRASRERGRPRPLVGTPRRGVRGGFGETALPPCPPRPLCPPPIRRMSSVAGGDARAPSGFARNTCCAANTLLCAAHQATYLLNVAKGSLGELRDDYLKWLLRARRLQWDDNAPDARAVRRMDLDPAPGGKDDGRDGSAGRIGRDSRDCRA